MVLRAAVGFVLALTAAAAVTAAQAPSPAPADDLTALLDSSYQAYLAGDPARGYALLETVLLRARREGLPAIEAEALRRLAQAYRFRNERDKAVATLERARTLSAAAGDRVGEARVLAQLAEIRYDEGRRADAVALLREAAGGFTAAGDRGNLAETLDVLAYYLPDGADKEALRREALALATPDGRSLACGVLHEWGDELFTQGRAAEAFARIGEARACFHARPNPDGEARALVSLGRLYRLHGRLDDALAQYRQALALHDRPFSPDPQGAIQAMNAIAVTLTYMGRFDEARVEYEAALARARRTSPAVVPFMIANLGGLNLQLGRFDEALALFDEALRLKPAPEYLVTRLTQRSSALAGLGRRDEALAELDRAIPLAAARGPEDVVGVREVRARLYTSLGRYADAEADLRVAMAAIEEVRAHNVPSDVMRRGFLEAHQSTFGALIDLLGAQRKAGEALDVAEQARARAFLDLRAERAGDARPPAPATVAGARAVAARLRSTIVSYWVGPSALVIWVVRPAGDPLMVRVPVRPAQLMTLVRATAGLDDGASAARGLLMTDRAQRAPWRELERLLVEPIEPLLPRASGSRLTIVPHGPLFGLSFAGLRQPSGRYLLEDYDLHYVPAIAALSEPAGTRDVPAGAALVVGDPGPLDADAGAEPLPALPWARREADAVRAALGAETTVLADAEATEARVRASIGGRRVLHFATHGVVSNEPARPSYLALRPAPGVDGRLLADEIYDLALDADLVVLSACRSALGPVEGDGVIGLTRAFLSAGARSVVAAQWDVPDRLSYDVMRGFYARRARGDSTSRALRGAQLAVLAALRRGTVTEGGAALPEAPRLWAGFVLVGQP
jgi:CHAT domain-containing protein/tetratricopeptide (TPR) repeat protein